MNDEPESTGAPLPETSGRTAYLGRYEDLEMPVVIDILAAHGIRAFAKHDPLDADHAPYAGMMSDRGVVLVDAARAEEAKEIVQTELPAHLESIREAMAELEALDEDDGSPEPLGDEGETD